MNKAGPKNVSLYADGACSGNPGPGGFACVIVYGEAEKQIVGGAPETTNNRMELMAIITGLEALKTRCRVDVYTDSQYAADGIEKGWAARWQANGWRKLDGNAAKNPDLWERLLSLGQKHTIKMHWIKGHADNEYNNRCDKLAVEYYKKYFG